MNVALREPRQKLAVFLGRFLGGLAPRLIMLLMMVLREDFSEKKTHPFFWVFGITKFEDTYSKKSLNLKKKRNAIAEVFWAGNLR